MRVGQVAFRRRDVRHAEDDPSGRLPRRQREVIALRILLDLSTERTAELLGIAQGTVGAHLSKALARLERELVGTEITEVEG